MYFSDENVCLPSIVAAKGVVGASQTSESSFRDEISICIHVQGVWCKLFYFENLFSRVILGKKINAESTVRDRFQGL